MATSMPRQCEVQWTLKNLVLRSIPPYGGTLEEVCNAVSRLVISEGLEWRVPTLGGPMRNWVGCALQRLRSEGIIECSVRRVWITRPAAG